MMEKLQERLEKLMKDQGYSMKALSLKAGLSESFVRDIMKRGREPSVRNLALIAKVLNVTPSYLLGGEAPFKPSIPVIGYVTGSEEWTPYDVFDVHLDVDLTSKELVSIEIRGDSMAPVYRNGDYLICRRVDGASVHTIVGLDCAVFTSDEKAYIKILNRGSSATTYNLRSYNPTYPDIEDVKIKWAAPVDWIKRNNTYDT